MAESGGLLNRCTGLNLYPGVESLPHRQLNHNFFGHNLQFPLTTDSSAWYAGTSAFLFPALVTLTIYGFRIALAG